MSNGNGYTNHSQQVLLAVLARLGDHPLQPQPLAALTAVDALGEIQASRDQVFRACKNLEQAGFAEQQGEGWLLSPKLIRLAERLRLSIHHLHHTYLGDERCLSEKTPTSAG